MLALETATCLLPFACIGSQELEDKQHATLSSHHLTQVQVHNRWPIMFSECLESYVLIFKLNVYFKSKQWISFCVFEYLSGIYQVAQQ